MIRALFLILIFLPVSAIAAKNLITIYPPADGKADSYQICIAEKYKWAIYDVKEYRYAVEVDGRECVLYASRTIYNGEHSDWFVLTKKGANELKDCPRELREDECK